MTVETRVRRGINRSIPYTELTTKCQGAFMPSLWSWDKDNHKELKQGPDNTKVVGSIPVWAIHFRGGLDDFSGSLPTQTILWFGAIKPGSTNLGIWLVPGIS